ncbi:hypothetical protein [Kitasatospora cheerisanensis]|uniref:hypothetical protein n=1 Tax=Kitasatospora cheerisanensis TaxID=81942 RepID=UPI000565844B|nr:hypothetical protein [Kitasatospora cheerisanensis]
MAGLHDEPGGRRPAAGPRWGSPPQQQARAPEAERLLAERLARGEIEVAEYRERLAALRGESPPPPGGTGGPGDPGKG